MNNGEADGGVGTRGLWLLVLFVVLTIFGIGRLALGRQHDETAGAELRPDLVLLETAGLAGEAEKPPVFFKHDLHVTTLTRAGIEDVCLICHRSRPDTLLSFVFSGVETVAPDDLRDFYHDKCLSCHQERGQGPTPEECGTCHQRRPDVAPVHVPAFMDKSLHARHVSAAQDKCETCHPGDKQAGCRDCHGAVQVEKRLPLSDVCHLFCVNCHLDNEERKKATGPSDCAGCHDAEHQEAWEKLDPVPRLKYKQPDRVFIAAAAADSGARMPVVAFDHMLHEEVSNDCRSCHHQSLKACNECHTIDGVVEGGGVTLATAMHGTASRHSCVGCHEQSKAAVDCAGCHSQLPDAGMDERYCVVCHNGPMPGAPAGHGDHFDPASIPENISIDSLVDDYEAANFPHRAIVAKLHSIVDASPLADAFHGGGDRLCQGCHHHSPVGVQPPKCGSCHGEAFTNDDMHAPGLNGAYHRQCLGCHQEMGLKTGCTDCHAERTAGRTTAATGP